jgi:hypothetical protein
MNLITSVEANPRENIQRSLTSSLPLTFDSCHYALNGINDTVNTITCTLENSQHARNAYTCDRFTICEDYNRDIQQFDERLLEIMEIHTHSVKHRRKRAGRDTDNQPSKDICERRVIELSPTSATAEEGRVSNAFDDTMSPATEDRTMTLEVMKQQHQPPAKQILATEQNRKIVSLEELLQSLNGMMEIELDLLKQINERRSDLDSKTVIERESALEDCLRQQSRDTIALISSYQPKTDKYHLSHPCYKGKRKGLPTVERILQDVEKIKGEGNT